MAWSARDPVWRIWSAGTVKVKPRLSAGREGQSLMPSFSAISSGVMLAEASSIIFFILAGRRSSCFFASRVAIFASISAILSSTVRRARFAFSSAIIHCLQSIWLLHLYHTLIQNATSDKKILGYRQVVRHGTLTPAFAGSSPATPANYHKMLVRFCAKMLPSSNWNRRLASQAGNTGSSPVGSTKWCRGRIGRVAGLSSRSLRVQSPPASP